MLAVLGLYRGLGFSLTLTLIVGRNAFAHRALMASFDVRVALLTQRLAVCMAACITLVANVVLFAYVSDSKRPCCAHRNDVNRSIPAPVFVVLMPVDMVSLVFVGNETEIVDRLTAVQSGQLL